MKTRKILMSALVLLCLGLWSCKKEVESVSLRPVELELAVDDTYQMVAEVLPSCADQSVEWASSRSSVATVSASGLVTAVSEGTCDITVWAADKSAVCHLTVVARDPNNPNDPGDPDNPNDPGNPNVPVGGLTPDGAVDALFSISEMQQVRFSRGNLQYQASSDTWRFAENQYDVIGSDNSNISSSNSDYIDLFGWGTSGWNSGANAYYPYSSSANNSDYYPGGSYDNSLTDAYANADWGVYNAISNGGKQAGIWRTLTSAEWVYLFNTRPNASSKYGMATVNGVSGLLLLPDSWTLPSGCTFTAGRASGFATNTYTISQWASMQNNGAVFLPAAGYRFGTEVLGVGTYGYYWSSTYCNSRNAYGMDFVSGSVNPTNNSGRDYGKSVRLVQDN